jgi:uncharacterized protein YecT (DUF1311 family)
MNMKFWIAMAMLLATGNVVAEQACDAPKNDFDGLYCLNKIYQEADKELNMNYRALARMLDSSGRARLQDGQRIWIRSRDAACSRREADKFYVDLSCATQTTIDRSRFLQDRIRECDSTGCLDSRL